MDNVKAKERGIDGRILQGFIENIWDYNNACYCCLLLLAIAPALIIFCNL
jgi:hypothetical protein